MNLSVMVCLQAKHTSNFLLNSEHLYTCSFTFNLSSHPIKWQQHNRYNRSDTGQVMFTSYIRMGKKYDLCAFNHDMVDASLAS